MLETFVESTSNSSILGTKQPINSVVQHSRLWIRRPHVNILARALSRGGIRNAATNWISIRRWVPPTRLHLSRRSLRRCLSGLVDARSDRHGLPRDHVRDRRRDRRLRHFVLERHAQKQFGQWTGRRIL